MKKQITFVMGALAIFFASCKTEPNAEAVRKEILNIHDKLMIDGEKVVKNKMKLDTLLLSDQLKKSPDSVISKQQVRDIIARLNAADEKMMDWMHFFKDDFKGKTVQEDLDYYKSQMIKIRDVEDGYIKVTRQSDSVLKVYKIK